MDSIMMVLEEIFLPFTGFANKIIIHVPLNSYIST